MSKRHRHQRRTNPPTGREIRDGLGLPPLSIMGVPLEGSGGTMTCVLDDGTHIVFEPSSAMWMIGSGEVRRKKGVDAERMMAALVLTGMNAVTKEDLSTMSVDDLIESAQGLVAGGWITAEGLDVPGPSER